MKERGGVWGGESVWGSSPTGLQRMTGSAASTPCGSAVAGSFLAVVASYVLCSKINILLKKGEGSGEGVGLGSVADRALGGLREATYALA